MAISWLTSRRLSDRIPIWPPGRLFSRIAWAFPAALVALMTTVPAQAQTTATYTVTFKGNWTLDSTPGGVAGGAHFTTLVGAVHNDQVTFWESGGTATAGVEAVAEQGTTSSFASEVAAAGANASLVEESIGGSPTVTATFDIDVTTDRPLFTLLSMIGPSPDWFVGVSNLSLRDNRNQWLSDLEVDLFPYDAGTEDGTEFTLSNPATNPRGTIASIKGTGKFSDEPMAKLSFDLKGGEASNAAPVFTSSAIFSVRENNATVGTVRAVDSDATDSVTGYTISAGADRNLFSIASGGRLAFKTAPNYEDPQDAGRNNRYEVQVRATSGTGDRRMSVEQTIRVTVTDNDSEAPSSPSAPDVTAVSATMLQAAWTAPSNEGPAINDYDYRYRTSLSQGAWTEVTNTTIAGRSVTIDDLAGDTSYDVQVRANNAEGSSDWSSSGVGATQMAPDSVTTYTVTFQGNWTLDSTPGGVVGGAHFTTLVGAVHNDQVTFWESGGMATRGVEGVAELGSTGRFVSEVTEAGANAILVRETIGSSPTVTATFEIEATTDHPLFTLLSMIGPSPDWFVGVSGLSLLDDQGAWLSEHAVDLFPYDAGTEDGTEFTLNNSATNPQGTIESIRGTGKFSDEPMAMLSFDLKVTNTSTEREELPTEVTLSGNYPNPFNPETTIRYGLPTAEHVRLAVYNLLGQEVAILVDQAKSAGNHTARFGAGDLPSGVYVYRLQAGDEAIVRTMMLVK